MDLVKDENSVQQEATVDKAISYCQLCFDKYIEWFQISERESMTLCLNPVCSTSIAYDTNNNTSGGDGEAKKFKYSKEILEMSAEELQSFFEKDIETISCYKKLQNVLDAMSHPKSIDKVPAVAEPVVLPEAPKKQEVTPMSQEPNVISQNDYLNPDNFSFVENSNSMPLIGATDSGQFFNYDPTLFTQQMPIQQQQPFELPVFNQSESQATSNTIPASTFDDDFLALLNEDLTFTDLTKTYTNNDANNYNVASLPSFNGNTFSQELPMANETSDLTDLKTINHSDLMLELQGDLNLLSGNNNSVTSSVKNVIPLESNEIKDDTFEVIKDVKMKSGSQIKITKRKKKSTKQSLFENIELEDEGGEVSQESVQDTKTTATYDSIGENEDSSDHLLPWEVKSTKKKKDLSHQAKRISNLGLMSMSRSSPLQNKKSVGQHSSPSATITIPTNVTRADLSTKTSQAPFSNSSASLKKALTATSENSFQAELEKTSKISHLFNKSSILTPTSGAGAGGYKNLVLNVLKKKTQA